MRLEESENLLKDQTIESVFLLVEVPWQRCFKLALRLYRGLFDGSGAILNKADSFQNGYVIE